MFFSCILTKVKSVLDNHFVYSYGKELDRYIISNNPQNNADVERLMFEYANKIKRGML